MKPKQPRPPACLSEKAKGIWKTINREYELETEAAQTLQVALENLDLADTARALLREQGLIIDGKRHPASDIVKQCDGMFLRSMRALGLDVIAPGSGQVAGRRP